MSVDEKIILAGAVALASCALFKWFGNFAEPNARDSVWALGNAAGICLTSLITAVLIYQDIDPAWASTVTLMTVSLSSILCIDTAENNHQPPRVHRP